MALDLHSNLNLKCKSNREGRRGQFVWQRFELEVAGHGDGKVNQPLPVPHITCRRRNVNGSTVTSRPPVNGRSC